MDKPARAFEGSFTEGDQIANIRLATTEDLRALEWDGEYAHYRRLFKRAIDEARHGRRILLLAEIDDQLVGQIFIQLTIRAAFSTRGASSGYFYAFRVKPAFRNQGVGSSLLQKAEDNLAIRGFHRAVISVAKRNFAARRLYERAGYSVFAEDPGEWSYVDHKGKLRQVREPAFVLEKRL
ncbi:MAG: GNAT family N-acetyltransferase [Anaerolineales bacterium]